MNQSAIDRFWSGVVVGSDSDCWPWKKSTNKFGHGHFRMDGVVFMAHRLAYFLSNGKLHPDDVVRHTCDTPSCCNPKHLIIGSHADNVADRVSRGRSASGTRNGRSKLTEQQVLKIFHDTRSSTVIANEYGVDGSIVRLIKKKKIWKSVLEGNGATYRA